SDIKIPSIYKFIIKYVTPLLLLLVFLGALFTPLGNDWAGNISSLISGNGWALDNTSIVKQLTHAGIKEQMEGVSDATVLAGLEERMFYSNFARLQLMALFLLIALIVYISFTKRRREGRNTL